MVAPTSALSSTLYRRAPSATGITTTYPVVGHLRGLLSRLPDRAPRRHGSSHRRPLHERSCLIPRAGGDIWSTEERSVRLRTHVSMATAVHRKSTYRQPGSHQRLQLTTVRSYFKTIRSALSIYPQYYLNQDIRHKVRQKPMNHLSARAKAIGDRGSHQLYGTGAVESTTKSFCRPLRH